MYCKGSFALSRVIITSNFSAWLVEKFISLLAYRSVVDSWNTLYQV